MKQASSDKPQSTALLDIPQRSWVFPSDSQLNLKIVVALTHAPRTDYQASDTVSFLFISSTVLCSKFLPL